MERGCFPFFQFWPFALAAFVAYLSFAFTAFMYFLAFAACVALSGVVDHKSSHIRKFQFSDRHCKFRTKFSPTVANFQQGRLWVLKIPILPLNCPRIRFFSSKFCIFEQKLSDKDFWTKRRFPTANNLWLGTASSLRYPATMPLVALKKVNSSRRTTDVESLADLGDGTEDLRVKTGWTAE